MTPDFYFFFLSHYPVSRAANLMKDLVLQQISSDKWLRAALETWLNIQDVSFPHELQDLSLFSTKSWRLTDQDVVVQLVGSGLQILLWAKQVQVFFVSFFFFSPQNWLPQLFHFIIWSLRKRWSALIPGHLPVAAQSLEITNWCWLFCTVP